MAQSSDYHTGNQAAQAGEQSSHDIDTGQALLSLVQDVFGDVPDDEWRKLPSDLAYQHDHYLYGTPHKP